MRRMLFLASSVLVALAVVVFIATLVACGSASGALSGYLRTPAWSPDGRHVAFVRFQDGYNEIYVMNADGSHLRRLTGPRQDLIDELSSQAWSPDGRKLVFARGSNMSTPRARPSSIFVVNADGTGIRQLTYDDVDDDPAWSPDGRRIAFARYGSTNHGSIYVMNADGTHQHELPTPLAEVAQGNPAWSPDATELAFATFEGRVEIVRLDGTLVRHLRQVPWRRADGAAFDVDYYSPTWSPDGSKLAFMADAGSDAPTWIETRNVVGSGRRVLTDSREVDIFEYPAWSPSGRQIAFDIYGKLMVMNADGTNAHALTPK